MKTKVCKKCGAEKSTAEFHFNGGMADMRESSCKECRRARARKLKAKKQQTKEIL